MHDPEIIGAIMNKSFNENSKLQKKFLYNEIFNRWEEIFPKFANKCLPVKVQDETLFIYSENNTFKNMLKFNTAEIIRRINEVIFSGKKVISEIKFSSSSKRMATTSKKNPAKKVSDRIEIELTPEEIAACEKKAAAVIDENQRQILFELMLSHAKSEKRKLKSGWHKCKLCNLLCPPKDIFCNICLVKEREKMQKEIRKIFLAAPETSFSNIRQQVIDKFPDLKKECTLEMIESVRMDLIAEKAAKVPYNDKTSDNAKFLVRLIRQLPPEKVTPQIIEKTLTEFKFNLANLSEYFAKLEKAEPLEKFED